VVALSSEILKAVPANPRNFKASFEHFSQGEYSSYDNEFIDFSILSFFQARISSLCHITTSFTSFFLNVSLAS
jgi:hypothetical protein